MTNLTLQLTRSPISRGLKDRSAFSSSTASPPSKS